MHRYVIRMTHPPDQCPTADARIREVVVKGAPELPRLAQRLGEKFLAGPSILGADHETVVVVDPRPWRRCRISSSRAAWSSGTRGGSLGHVGPGGARTWRECPLPPTRRAGSCVPSATGESEDPGPRLTFARNIVTLVLRCA